MSTVIRPFSYVAIRLQSDTIRIEHIEPNKSINLGKFGTFNTNSIIGRPFHVTFEVLDKSKQVEDRQLRVVKASEIHADVLLEEAESELHDGTSPGLELDEYGQPSTEKSNVAIFDNQENQKLTMAEIEALKADETATPKDLIARIMASHSQLDQKTAFSLAKYTLRKQKKYMRRFTVLPLDVATFVDYMMAERDFTKVMEIRNEALGLIGSWANVHAVHKHSNHENEETEPQCRYLVVDDTGGLVVAALAERMGTLHHNNMPPKVEQDDDDQDSVTEPHPETQPAQTNGTTNGATKQSSSHRRHKRHYHDQLAVSNTLTMIHSNSQPNLNLLRYFNFDPNLPPAPNTPKPHPLHTHLKTLSWLQLIDPEADTTYAEPPHKTQEEVHAMKSNARSTHYRKRRRWEKCRSIVDETRAGGFNGLVVASYTNCVSILHRLVPLLAGGAQIVVYSSYIEPLLNVVDAYSTPRRTAFLNLDESEREAVLGTEAFPLDPTLTLGFMVQTARARKWQVLPGRTHPTMMGRGGADGYVASATRVLPVKGKIEARGTRARVRSKNKVETEVMIEKDEEDGDSNGETSGDHKRLKVDDSTNAVDDTGAEVIQQETAQP